jgi:xanthine dehydrogenase accessory factor
MNGLFQTLRQCMLDGDDTVLVTVIASSGSTPRGAGARMLVGKNGRLYGTIGGGAIEYKAGQIAEEVLKEKRSFTKGYKLAPKQVEDLGMICGGDVVVYYQYIAAEDRGFLSLVERILNLLKSDEDSWLLTDITDETAWKVGVYSKSTGLAGLELREDELKPLLKGRSLQISAGSRKYYSEPLVRAGKVVIFGGGHIAQELVPVLAHVGFRCTVVDDREEFATRKLFPMAEEVIVGNFERVMESVVITWNDYVVIATRGHNYDFVVLEQVLRTDAYYIGMIGSRQKIASTNARLLEAGILQQAIDRVFTPIGTPIKAETPAEIAISIAGELIMVRADRLEQHRGAI